MEDRTQAPAASPALAGPALGRLATTLPPHVWFGVSAVFHYLGPAFAVLLFPHVGVLGMAWLRIATAALVFAPLTRPWRIFARADRPTRLLLLAFGACLAVMNCSFYLALDRLPISLVAAIEFVGTIGVALVGLRSPRNLAALAVAVTGTLLLIDVKWSSDPDRPVLGLPQRRAVRRLHRARPPRRPRRRRRRHRRPRRRHGDRLPRRAADRLHRCAARLFLAAAACSPPSASASARRSFPTSATSLPCRGCRARASR